MESPAQGRLEKNEFKWFRTQTTAFNARAGAQAKGVHRFDSREHIRPSPISKGRSGTASKFEKNAGQVKRLKCQACTGMTANWAAFFSNLLAVPLLPLLIGLGLICSLLSNL